MKRVNNIRAGMVILIIMLSSAIGHADDAASCLIPPRDGSTPEYRELIAAHAQKYWDVAKMTKGGTPEELLDQSALMLHGRTNDGWDHLRNEILAELAIILVRNHEGNSDKARWNLAELAIENRREILDNEGVIRNYISYEGVNPFKIQEYLRLIADTIRKQEVFV